jgi:hypothetical protein
MIKPDIAARGGGPVACFAARHCLNLSAHR